MPIYIDVETQKQLVEIFGPESVMIWRSELLENMVYSTLIESVIEVMESCAPFQEPRK